MLELGLGANWLAAAVALVTLASYALVYTPLKRVTSLATVIGAVPGALPPVIGWAASRGSLGLEAWVLFAIVFVWQMPHVLAVSWLYREDYERGGVRVLPVEDPGRPQHGVPDGELRGRARASQPACPRSSASPAALYLAGAIVLGIALLALTDPLRPQPDAEGARRLFAASLVYLPVLWVLMLGDRL